MQKNSFRGPSQRTILFVIGAAKEEMPSGFGPECADLPLAASVELAENSRHGFTTKTPALHLGHEIAYSRTALGLPISCPKTALDRVVPANNPLPGVPSPRDQVKKD